MTPPLNHNLFQANLWWCAYSDMIERLAKLQHALLFTMNLAHAVSLLTLNLIIVAWLNLWFDLYDI